MKSAALFQILFLYLTANARPIECLIGSSVAYSDGACWFDVELSCEIKQLNFSQTRAPVAF